MALISPALCCFVIPLNIPDCDWQIGTTYVRTRTRAYALAHSLTCRYKLSYSSSSKAYSRTSLTTVTCPKGSWLVLLPFPTCNNVRPHVRITLLLLKSCSNALPHVSYFPPLARAHERLHIGRFIWGCRGRRGIAGR